MGRSRCSREQEDEFDLGFPGETRTANSTWGTGEQGRVPGWRQRFENHLWRHRAEGDEMPQDGQGELKTGPMANHTWEETLEFANLDSTTT